MNVKDELLRCYLEPYCAKILYTNRPLVYVDCFAGKGKFEDGNIGSPIIALEIFRNTPEKSGIRRKGQFVESNFIELAYPSNV